MLYCTPCGEKAGWPEGLGRSRGPCEVCGKVADCSDVPSRYLPEPRVAGSKPGVRLSELERAVWLLMSSDDYAVVRRGADGKSAELVYVHNSPPHPVTRIEILGAEAKPVKEKEPDRELHPVQLCSWCLEQQHLGPGPAGVRHCDTEGCECWCKPQ